VLSYLFTNPLSFLIFLAALFLAISIHEAAHAWAADRLGDPTARFSGRLTLNPFAHLDPLGTLMLFLFGFGWGKPVPVDYYNLRQPRRDAALISLAGPLSNLVLAIFISLAWRLGIYLSPPSGQILSFFFFPLLQLNLVLGIFNLLPLSPLDGGKILTGLLPSPQSEAVEGFLESYSLILLILLFLPLFGGHSLLDFIISPVINFFQTLLTPHSSLL
jgi:Zn-dependent protease